MFEIHQPYQAMTIGSDCEFPSKLIVAELESKSDYRQQPLPRGTVSAFAEIALP
jgi:hypothetical protein